MAKSFKDILSNLGNRAANKATDWLTDIFGVATYEIDDNGIRRIPNPSRQPASTTTPMPMPTPTPTPLPTPMPTPMPTPTPTPDNLAEMTRMLSIYGGNDAPIHQYAAQLNKARQTYDFWNDNPELLALLPHLETSSGRNITRPNNLTNWGINYPGNNEIFAQMTPEEVLDRFITGVAERSPYYADFRTGEPLTDEELLRFASIYEPANQGYGQNLVEGRRHIRQQLGW